ncbi:MAG: cobalamin biosynthesis protein [Brasilonema octagenarum HA4186-MV1]|uniref:Cobalamin biosynthesis protein CbiG n=1 Tax=Brasilonema octagenarum UFV-OR1 TaxID=417115 RepID=A0ABX1M7B9_9CYAN|nr:cobalamin biosynthesis protein [Brasilonema octagenarum]MBW4626697.1 cobalamin biosynthesis protein [Brasilonema octagenarum HA4186-MV1]NMF64460.1 cobalamin biosynthesis protein CbiG [Brasilonema octagenarum UFV-OR1]
MREIINQVASKHRVLWVGIGCTRGTSRQLIERAIGEVFRENQLAENAIAGFATINSKSEELGLLELCQHQNLFLKTFPPDVLSQVCVPNPSQVVGKKVGTCSVAEAAALCAASNFTFVESSQIMVISVGLGVKLVVPKQIFSLKGLPGIVTIAVAQALS